MKTLTQETCRTALIAATLCLCFHSKATDIYKADTADTLNLGSSWTNEVAPTAADVAVWDSTVQLNTTSTLGADASGRRNFSRRPSYPPPADDRSVGRSISSANSTDFRSGLD